MNVLLLGGGGVGSLLAGYLHRAGREVTVVDPWFHHVETVRRDGLRILAVEEEFVADPDYRHIDELEDVGRADVVVIATKSYHTSVAARLARDHMHAGTVVLSAQNGMNDLPIASIVGAEAVVGCVVLFGAHLLEPGLVRRSSTLDSGSVVLGEIAPAGAGGGGAGGGGGDRLARLARLAELFAPLGAVRTVGDIWPERWSKLTLNTMSNALAGITGLNTAELWSSDTALDVLIALGRETATVADAAEVQMASVFGRITHDHWMAADTLDGPAWDDIRMAMHEVGGERTGPRANIPSLLQDVLRHRRTEVDYLNGWVIAEAKRRGVPVPTHELVVEALRPVVLGQAAPDPSAAGPLADAVGRRYGGG